MIKKKFIYKSAMIFTILVLFSSVWLSCKNPSMLTGNDKKENIDITEIKIGSLTFKKGKALDSLNKKELELSASENPLKIDVKANKISSDAKLYVNKSSLGIPFKNGIANYTLDIKKAADIKLRITDSGKEDSVYNFKVKLQEPASPLPPPSATIDVTEIKVDSHVFRKNELNSLAGKTLEVNKNSAEIIVKASNVSGAAGIKINGQALVSFTNREAKQTVSISSLTAVKLEIFDTAKQTLVYTFKVKKQSDPIDPGKPEVQKIEVISTPEFPVEKDGDTNYIMTLLLGAEYDISSQITPSDAQNPRLSFSVPEHSQYLKVTSEGRLTVLEKPLFNSDLPYVKIASSNDKVIIRLSVKVDYGIDSMIKEWSFTGTGVVGNPNTATIVNLPNGEASTAELKLVKRNPYIKYQHKVSSKHIKLIDESTVGSSTDQYQIQIDKNKTVWKKNTSIDFFVKEYNPITRKIEEKILKTFYINQGENFTFEKKIEWVHGVKEPTQAELSKRRPFEYAEWDESSTTTWFGVRKISYTTNLDYDDTKMCWAMTAANMLHWWFEQNHNNIEEYKRIKNIIPDSDEEVALRHPYKRGYVIDESLKSGIATRLRLGFHNNGNPVTTALEWYLHSRENFPPTIQKSNSPKLFNGLFPDKLPLTNFVQLTNKEQVNTLFKTAIRNKEVMAVTYQWGGEAYPLGHVVTVWGISLDGDENVFEFWVADSDVDKSKGYPYIYNMGIHYRGNGSPKFVNLTIENEGKYTENLYKEITTLKLGTSAFQEFFSGQ